MRVLVCGGRDYSDYEMVAKTLLSLFPPATDDISTWLPPSDTVIIHGGARGADALADQWAVCNWLVPEVYPADWDKHGRAAGPLRNQRMLDEGKPDLVVAFSGGSGTIDMVRRARKTNMRVIEVR